MVREDIISDTKIFFNYGLPQAFFIAYRANMHTDLYQEFSKKLHSQSKYNVYFYWLGGNSSEINGGPDGLESIEDDLEYIIQCKNSPFQSLDKSYYKYWNINDISRPFKTCKKVITIGISVSGINNFLNIYTMARILNHEIGAHAIDDLNGNKYSIEQDHYIYYHHYSYSSPDYNKIETDPKYKNTPAKKNWDQIKRTLKIMGYEEN